MGGKSDDSSSREMINMQKAEAAEARAKEEKRQARIKQGLERIKQTFEGKAETKTSKGAPLKLTGDKLPAGYKYITQGGTPAGTQTTSTNDPRTGRNINKTVATPGKAGKQMVQGPDGKIYEVGATVTPTVTSKTGKTIGGIGDDYYNEYKKGILDYYTPQVEEQYGNAKDELTYRLARAGTLRSSAAAEETADLSKQHDIQTGQVLSQADEAAAAKRKEIAAAKTAATNQLYATENPDVAANQATAAITNITADEPDLTPLGQIFNIATIGAANYLTGAQRARMRNEARAATGGYGATTVVS
jgi:hypothetical protein